MAGNPPPYVVSVTPTDKTKTADPIGKVVLTFSEPLDATTVNVPDATLVNTKGIKLLDGDSVVPATVAYADSKVTITPALPLALLASYKVSVQNTVKDAAGAPMLAAFVSTFTVRDGAWKMTPVLTGKAYGLSETLPISANGSALVAYHSGGDGDKDPGGCAARWFLRETSTPEKRLADSSETECNGITAGANAAGIAAVAWQDPDATHGNMANQFRAGAWQASGARVAADTTTGFARAAVSPKGMVTYLAHGASGSFAWRTNANGVWIAQPDSLSTDVATSAASIAFDAAENGFAVWTAKTAADVPETLFSRYTASSGKWSQAGKIPNVHAVAGTIVGAPTVALGDNGDAKAIWVEYEGDGYSDLLASTFFHTTEAWSATPAAVDAAFTDARFEAPGLVFDGKDFVAAWLALRDNGVGACAAATCVYTNRYSVATAKWGTPITQQSAADDVSAPHMPALATDSRGNLMLVWAKPAAAGVYSLVYERYLAGKWGAITLLPDGAVADKTFPVDSLALSMNPSGMAALAWANYDNLHLISSIQLASFY